MTSAVYLVTRRLLRRCPHCAFRQLVGRAKQAQAVICRRCGKTIPPKPLIGRRKQ